MLPQVNRPGGRLQTKIKGIRIGREASNLYHLFKIMKKVSGEHESEISLQRFHIRRSGHRPHWFHGQISIIENRLGRVSG